MGSMELKEMIDEISSEIVEKFSFLAKLS